jgi:hypothetical protein
MILEHGHRHVHWQLAKKLHHFLCRCKARPGSSWARHCYVVHHRLISPRVLTKVEDAVKVEPAGEFELKGIRRPLAAYNVVGALSREPE